MPLKLAIGDRFPSLELPDQRGEMQSIESIVDGKPTILAFFRGPW